MRQCAAILYAMFILAAVLQLAAAAARPDGGDIPPLPGPGLSYGGIPYGSMSGNVAEFFKRQATPTGRSLNLASYSSNGIDYSPIQQQW